MVYCFLLQTNIKKWWQIFSYLNQFYLFLDIINQKSNFGTNKHFMKKFELKTEITQFDQFKELLPDEQELILKAREACLHAYAPYSEFKVGVALLLENGQIIIGSNQENAAYPSGLCAERTAIFWANSQYPHTAILKMAISSLNKNNKHSELITPCGACRQVMVESELRFKKPIKIILDGERKILSLEKVTDLLPLYFNAEDLK